MRPDHGLDVRGAEGVSIHAPARGATVESKAIATYINVSIHAPARGATTEVHVYLR